MSNHDDAIFVRNFSIVLVGLSVIGVMAFILVKIIDRGFQATQTTSEAVAARIEPIGQLNRGGEPIMLAGDTSGTAQTAAASAPAAAPAAAEDGNVGKAVYDRVCFACHAQGIAGAPKQGDMAAWEARLEKDIETLYRNAIEGFVGDAGMMPAKGGNPSLSDAEVKASVDYMLAAVGVGDGDGDAAAADAGDDGAAGAEPAADADGAAATEDAAAPADAADATAEGAADPAAGGSEAASAERGEEVYDAACFVCHTPGAAGAPKLGDAAAWAPRLEKGIEQLYSSSINGFMGDAGMMPPKGGRPDFSDAEVKAAVDYMVSKAR